MQRFLCLILVVCLAVSGCQAQCGSYPADVTLDLTPDFASQITSGPHFFNVTGSLCVALTVNSYPTLTVSLVPGGVFSFNDRMVVYAPSAYSSIASTSLSTSGSFLYTGSSTWLTNAYPYNYWNYLVTPPNATLQLFLYLLVQSSTVQLTVGNTDISLVADQAVAYPNGLAGAFYFLQETPGNPCQTDVSYSLSFANSSNYISYYGEVLWTTRNNNGPYGYYYTGGGYSPLTNYYNYYLTGRPNRVAMFFQLNNGYGVFTGQLTVGSVDLQQVDCQQNHLDDKQTQAMADLQKQWGAQLGWSGDAQYDACTWSGVSCTTQGFKQQVVGLNVAGQQLTGAVPQTLGNLVYLQSLDLSDNRLSGGVPASVSTLINLRTLDLSANSFSGSLPSGVNALPVLKALNVSTNLFIGSLPTLLPSMPIAAFDASHNGFYGALPFSYSELTSLQQLYLQSNALTGTVPSFVCKLAAYNLQDNNWKCPLPACCSSTGNSMCTPCTGN